MAKPLLMAQYHKVVIDELKKISWVANADTYPEVKTELITPAVFVSVPDWENKDDNGGQLNISMNVELFIVVDGSSVSEEKPEIYIRAAAADLTQWIHNRTFAFDGAMPAMFLSAQIDEFDPEMDDYLVFRISYKQDAAIGSDPDEIDAPPLQEVWLGAAPDIGAAHINNYRLIYKRKDDE